MPLADAIELMKGAAGGSALVCEAGRPIGALTEYDVLTRILGENVDLSDQVRDWMTPVPEPLTVENTIGDAVRVMNEEGCLSVPLVRDGQIAGMVSVFDVIEYLAECYPKETMNLPPDPAQVMDSQEGG
jgi:CBS domain-containing protein